MNHYLVLALIANVFAAVIAAVVADKKGYSAELWLILGLIFGLLGLFAIAVMPAGKKRVRIAFSDSDEGNYRQCPLCKELVLREAARCKHCQSDLEPLSPFQRVEDPHGDRHSETKGSSRDDWVVIAIIVGVLFLVWLAYGR
ncbi:MAG: hypothetical protein QGG80_05875 [Candidatus Krumholzibacteria bacterium]|jgi:hypothetical protein|nr:hypothetical protein [Candidatus Krumholzibacteria bacterium]MDP6796553.1 hypothetical protein [Candidatus Krumholzibacteria bacterium]MDP7021141.1 hypothetical protein [Candidatus Krumholzibacteria bacterium]